MTQHDLERIARGVLKELGLGNAPLTFEAMPEPGRWRLVVKGRHPLTIRCGPGTTTQFVRNQIFEELQKS